MKYEKSKKDEIKATTIKLSKVDYEELRELHPFVPFNALVRLAIRQFIDSKKRKAA